MAEIFFVAGIFNHLFFSLRFKFFRSKNEKLEISVENPPNIKRSLFNYISYLLYQITTKKNLAGVGTEQKTTKTSEPIHIRRRQQCISSSAVSSLVELRLACICWFDIGMVSKCLSCFGWYIPSPSYFAAPATKPVV